MNRFDVDSISWKNTAWVLSGNYVLFSKLYEIGKKAASHRTPGSQVQRRADESDGVRRRVLAADSLYLFWAVEAGKLSLSASLEWAEEALKRHARVSDGDAAIRVLRFSPYFGLIAWFSSCLADRAGGKFVLATAMIFF